MKTIPTAPAAIPAATTAVSSSRRAAPNGVPDDAGSALTRRVGSAGSPKRRMRCAPIVIRQLRMLGIVGFPPPTYDAQTGTWQMRKSSASG